MAELIMPESPFGQALNHARHGLQQGPAGLSITWEPFRTQAEVAVFDGAAATLEKAAKAAAKADVDARVMHHAASRNFIFAKNADVLAAVRKAVPAAQGAVIDQSHGRVALAVAGPKVEDTLSKLFAVDFHIAAFPAGTGIATAHHVIFALIWRESAERFILFPHRSFARAFLSDLIRAGAEYGVVVSPQA